MYDGAVVADLKLLLVAICVLSQWTQEQIVSTYRLTTAECTKYFVRLDHIGVIELKPLNRYRLKLAKTFRWRPHGPVMDYFRNHALHDYFSGAFDPDAEMDISATTLEAPVASQVSTVSGHAAHSSAYRNPFIAELDAFEAQVSVLQARLDMAPADFSQAQPSASCSRAHKPGKGYGAPRRFDVYEATVAARAK